MNFMRLTAPSFVSASRVLKGFPDRDIEDYIQLWRLWKMLLWRLCLQGKTLLVGEYSTPYKLPQLWNAWWSTARYRTVRSVASKSWRKWNRSTKSIARLFCLPTCYSTCLRWNICLRDFILSVAIHNCVQARPNGMWLDATSNSELPILLSFIHPLPQHFNVSHQSTMISHSDHSLWL